MNCPKCGRPYSKDELFCANCNTPLGNALYTPVAGRRKKKRRPLIAAAVVLIILLTAGFFGYRYYLSEVRRRCTGAVDTVFEHAKTLDFSDVDPQYLPDELKEHPDVRDIIREVLNDQLSKAGLNEYLDVDSLDLDPLIDEITGNSSYEIVSTDVTWNRCTVRVRTSNTDFSALPAIVMKELKSQISESDSSLWDNVREYFSHLFGFSDSDKKLSEIVVDLYRDAKAEAPDKTAEGEIVFGIKDRKWTLRKFDKDLLYSFYGFDEKDLPDSLTDTVDDSLDNVTDEL